MPTLLFSRLFKMMIFLRGLLMFFFFLSALVQAEVAVPELKLRVTDLTQTLSAAEISQLENKLAQMEQAKGGQIVILIVPSTEPETIEQFSIRVVEQWKLGRKKIDDGVLLLVAKNDRTARIEVGYGLEGAIPDVIANRVIDEYIVPAFKAGDFFGGIDQAVQKLVGLTLGEPLPEPKGVKTNINDFFGGIDRAMQKLIGLTQDKPLPTPKDIEKNINDSWIYLLFIGLVAAGGIIKAVFGRIIGSGLGGVITGIVSWLVLGSVMAGVLFGFLVFIFILGDVFFGGGDDGADHDGGGHSRSDGFSGGGGRFGGGGATGRW